MGASLTRDDPAGGPLGGRPIGVRRPQHDARTYAALDLGTNNCRLLIAESRSRGFRVVDAFSRIVRLGEGLTASGRLGEPAMARTIEALKICGRKIAGRRVARARLIATEACRAAANGAEFLDRVRDEAGLELEIVSRETEAHLAVAGCAELVDRGGDGALLFDIGGGSSELAWVDLTRPPGGEAGAAARESPPRASLVRSWASLPVGVVSLAERFGGIAVDDGVFQAMVDEVSDLLDDLPDAAALDRAVASGRLHLLGTSGTVTTIAGVHLGLARYERRRVDGLWLGAGDVSAMVSEIRAMDYPARVASPCIGAERADLVIAGCAILEAIHRRWPCARLRVADRGLREGILSELIAADRRRNLRGPAQ